MSVDSSGYLKQTFVRKSHKRSLQSRTKMLTEKLYIISNVVTENLGQVRFGLMIDSVIVLGLLNAVICGDLKI